MKTVLILSCLLAWVTGCATQAPTVATHYDDVLGSRTDLLSDNLLETTGQPREVVWLNASRVWKNRSESSYYLEVAYMAKDETGYLEIPSGETLTILLDGVPLKFDGTGSGNMRKPYKKEFVKESAIYPASQLELQKIATARVVQVQVKGKNGLILRDFGPENFEKFRAFVSRFAL